MARKASVKFDEWFMFHRRAMLASIYKNFSHAAFTVMRCLLHVDSAKRFIRGSAAFRPAEENLRAIVADGGIMKDRRIHSVVIGPRQAVYIATGTGARRRSHFAARPLTKT
jgi:hypothetical protein